MVCVLCALGLLGALRAQSPGYTLNPASLDLEPPSWLSCSDADEWQSLSVALSVLANTEAEEVANGTLEDPFPGLPPYCVREDRDLVKWMIDGLVTEAWPSDEKDAWEEFRRTQYKCGGKINETGEAFDCDHGVSGHLCLYGTVAACSCMMSMFARHSTSMADTHLGVFSAAKTLHWLLQSERKMLEFLDSSTWTVMLNDVANLVDVYRDVLAHWKETQTATQMASYLRPSTNPWSTGSSARVAAETASQASLERISSWRWPPAFTAPVSLSTMKYRDVPQLVRMWVFGTHCSVMAEPVASLAILLTYEYQFEVSWRGAADYCKFHSGSNWPVVKADMDSPFRQLYDRHWHRRESYGAFEHKDSVQHPAAFVEEMQGLLARDAAFQVCDVAACSEPAISCLALSRAGKPIIGYFGVHISFMVQDPAVQIEMYKHFQEELAANPRNTLATVAPYLSMQLYNHVDLELPSVRPLSLYTQPAVYSARHENMILINKRPVPFWDRRLLLETFARISGIDLNFFDATEFKEASFEEWASCRAGVYFPYDWLQTMAFYDWINMAIPTFVPDSPMYTINRGTNSPSDFQAAAWRPTHEVYPFHYSDWDDFAGRVYWWRLTDFCALPNILLFSSVPHLMQSLMSQDDLWLVSAGLRREHLARVASTQNFWKEALLRSLSDPMPRTGQAQVSGSKVFERLQ